MPNLPDDDTLRPYKNQPTRRFERTINIPGGDGKTRMLDEYSRDGSKAETERIANLAPAKDEDGGQWIIVAAVALILIGIGILIGLRIQ